MATPECFLGFKPDRYVERRCASCDRMQRCSESAGLRSTVKHDSPNDTQIGGTHYKDLKIQPWEVMGAWGPKEHFIGFLRFCILKRLGRWDSKDSSIQDMRKARHELDKLIEIMEAENDH